MIIKLTLMVNSVIVVEELSKRYRIGAKEKNSDTFAGQMASLLKAPISNFRRLTNLSRFSFEDDTIFWALKDVFFEVKEGEILGIVGHNGAGKSTLLKILSRITEPTTGRVAIKGRVSSLLEVGTGFHPELTGRENIYMNGTILGMRKKEIDRKLEEIISFSGIERHIDTPVKFYSSGMKVRLGFSVAAHLEPEILIIDEVLAVGDLEFQRKCLGKMEAVAGAGRTVLFVSHSMGAIRQLCTSCIVMKAGRIAFTGSVNDGIALYTSLSGGEILTSYFSKDKLADSSIELIEGEILDARYKRKSRFNADEEIVIRIKCAKNDNIPGLLGYLLIRNDSDEVFIESDTYDFLPNIMDELKLGVHSLVLKIPSRVLPKGRFKVYFNFTSSFAINGHNLDSPKDILSFEVYDTTTRRAANRKAYSNTIVQWKNADS